MAHPLMPKATAVWLVDNTTLTFRQIAEFVGLHELEVQAIADGDVAIGMQGSDPVKAGAITAEEIARCEGDAAAVLQPAKLNIPQPKARQKGARYTPVSKRGDRPNAIAWLVKNYPELSDAQISKLIGTTKPTINSVRDRTHWNSSNIKPENPVSLGLCSAVDLEKVVAVARARAGTVHAPQVVETVEAPAETTEDDAPASMGEPDVASVFGAPAPAPEPASSEKSAEDLMREQLEAMGSKED